MSRKRNAIKRKKETANLQKQFPEIKDKRERAIAAAKEKLAAYFANEFNHPKPIGNEV